MSDDSNEGVGATRRHMMLAVAVGAAAAPVAGVAATSAPAVMVPKGDVTVTGSEVVFKNQSLTRSLIQNNAGTTALLKGLSPTVTTSKIKVGPNGDITISDAALARKMASGIVAREGNGVCGAGCGKMAKASAE
jgi:hypothetical protein